MHPRFMAASFHRFVYPDNDFSNFIVASGYQSAKRDMAVTHFNVFCYLARIPSRAHSLYNAYRRERAAAGFPEVDEVHSVLLRQPHAPGAFLSKKPLALPAGTNLFPKRYMIHAGA